MHYFAGKGFFSEIFPRMNVRYVHFYFGNINGFQSISEGYRGVRISSKVSYQAINVLRRHFLNFRNQLPFDVTLKELNVVLGGTAVVYSLECHPEFLIQYT